MRTTYEVEEDMDKQLDILIKLFESVSRGVANEMSNEELADYIMTFSIGDRELDTPKDFLLYGIRTTAARRLREAGTKTANETSVEVAESDDKELRAEEDE